MKSPRDPRKENVSFHSGLRLALIVLVSLC